MKLRLNFEDGEDGIQKKYDITDSRKPGRSGSHQVSVFNSLDEIAILKLDVTVA
jgi:hypothetical protein